MNWYLKDLIRCIPIAIVAYGVFTITHWRGR